MTKIAIVNFANSTGWYQQGQERLGESVNKFTDVSFFGFKSEAEIGSPLHKDNPYAFKIYSMQKAREQGYDVVIFMDASMYLVKPITPILEYIERVGYIMEEAGHYAGTWANANCLKYFNLSKEEAMKITMFSAGFIGLDFRKEISREFFARWKNAMLGGAFIGNHIDHRHDMTCGSIIAQHQLGMEYSRGGYFLAYIGEVYGKPSETSIIHLVPTV